MEVGNGVPPWWSKACVITGNMGMVGLKYSGDMYTVVVGGDTLDMQDN